MNSIGVVAILLLGFFRDKAHAPRAGRAIHCYGRHRRRLKSMQFTGPWEIRIPCNRKMDTLKAIYSVGFFLIC